MASVPTAPMLERGDSVPEPTADVGRDLELVQPPSDHGEDFMNRFTTMALAAGTLALATGSVAQAEMVEFNYTLYGYAPGNPDVTEWGMSHISDVTITDYTGYHFLLSGQTIEFQLDIGGQQVPVEFVDGLGLGFEKSFAMTTTIENVPNYGPMQIVIGGTGVYHPFSEPPRWEGTVAITWGPPGNPFGAPVTQNGIWSAQVVPAPGVVALFGLAGLAGRRRRD